MITVRVDSKLHGDGWERDLQSYAGADDVSFCLNRLAACLGVWDGGYLGLYPLALYFARSADIPYLSFITCSLD